MTTKRVACLLVALAVLLLSTPAGADNVKFPLVEAPAETLRLPNGGTCRTAGGTDLTLAPEVVLMPGDVWASEDARVRALGDRVTALSAENASLRASASDAPGWWGIAVIALAVAGGVAVGVAVR